MSRDGHKRTNTSELLDDLYTRAASRLGEDATRGLLVRQLANIELCVQPTPGERLFKYCVHLAYVLGQGCCYTTDPTTIDHKLIGQPALTTANSSLATRIAVLDGIYAGFHNRAAAEVHLTGLMDDRSKARAKFVVDNICTHFSLRAGMRVALLGVVREFINEFRGRDILVDAFDLDVGTIGTEVGGVLVLDGRHIASHIGASSVALVTGMSLWTNTFSYVATLARAVGVHLVVFAETGAHFSPYLLNYGARAVISEPFPFYVFGGTTILRYYSIAPSYVCDDASSNEQ
jgi:hypothetical protein